MRDTLLYLLPLALAACRATAPAPDAPRVREPVPSPQAPARDERGENHAAWRERGAELAREHPGAWVLIARGAVLGTWREFDAAWRAAEPLAAEVEHAYLYRAGVDDVETTFVLSPFTAERPHWGQLGRRVRRGWHLTIAAVGNTWIIGDRQVAWGDLEAALTLVNPCTSAEHRVRAVASNLFQEDLTLRPEDARALGLGRFTAPLPAYYSDREHPCEKVLVRVRVPELDIDVPALAFVLPEDVVRATAWPTRGLPQRP
jgi:hypothetical protein